jgi:hypothetical protein
MAGVENPFLATILKSICGLFGVCVGIYLSQNVLGRRPMMLIGHGLPALFMLGIGIAATVDPGSKAAGKAILACALLYHGFYNGFSGALSWPICSELVSSRLRVLTVGTGTGINYVFACKCRYSRDVDMGMNLDLVSDLPLHRVNFVHNTVFYQ